jgi:hypothetical protein
LRTLEVRLDFAGAGTTVSTESVPIVAQFTIRFVDYAVTTKRAGINYGVAVAGVGIAGFGCVIRSRVYDDGDTTVRASPCHGSPGL